MIYHYIIHYHTNIIMIIIMMILEYDYSTLKSRYDCFFII
jgi:hypothetical protein